MRHRLHYHIYALVCMSGLVMAALKLLLFQELGNRTARM
jgi:hypothetical protein